MSKSPVKEKKAAGGAGAKKGGNPTSSKTATKTSTKTSTVANPEGNITVTGGAGAGDTHVIIGGEGSPPKLRADKAARR